MAEAKALLIHQQFAFDLVLSDISMPGESGFDLLIWIKGHAPRPNDLPVLLMTGVLPDAESRLRGLSLGAVDYVVRPDDISELVIRSINAIDHHRKIHSLECALSDSQDLALVGRMLAAANHEIKNIAAIVKLSADQAANFLSASAPVDESIKLRVADNLRTSTSLLVDIVRGFKTVMTEDGQPSRILDLNKLIDETLKLMAFRTKSCLVVWDPSRFPSAMVRGQSTRIKQILINFVLNGMEAISELSPLEGGRIDVELVEQDTSWVARVRDNGIGFPAGVRTEFQAFETTRKLKGGQGLGLWLCNVLAQNMHGSISLRSDGPSLGAVAELSVPKATGESDYSFDLSSYLID